MKKTPKAIIGVSTSSIVGLRAIIAQEKSSRSTKVPGSSTSISAPKSNKGVSERIKQDDLPAPVSRKSKKVIYIAGVPYYQGGDDGDQLVDIDRKMWEEYEREEQKGSVASVHLVEDDEALEAQRRAERRDLIDELARDTAKGREEHRQTNAKRERDKMARLALIRAKASHTSPELSSNVTLPLPVADDNSWIFGSDEEDADSNSEGGSPRPKRPKTEESSEKPK